MTAISLLLSVTLCFFVIPKRYTAVASIMPPDSGGSPAMMLSALAGKGGLGALGGLAASLLHEHNSTALYIDLLESGTIADHLIDRFDLRKVYYKRYYVDAAKHLAHETKITDDKKSGVISIKVEDTDPARARDLVLAYLEELNKLVNQTSTSSARQERIFIEQRLSSVQSDLENAQIELSDFSSKNTTVDITAQTRAMVDAGARLQGEIVAERSGLESMRQVYTDDNIHVREAQARIGVLQHELNKLAGSSTPVAAGPASFQQTAGELYPSLRQLPRLAVRYVDLYRRVKVQEAVFELLTQQYEMARIEEAKDIPVVKVIDAPGIPEKKSFPPRVILSAILTFLAFAATSALLLLRERWANVDNADPRKRLVHAVTGSIGRRKALELVAKGAL
ncbi:MAG TPA: lipopolysaccharide biosynthesis protein [Bryocella sp.]|nr:lipopolysaccharide biosynthesis protein [Bryocella sp.]